MNARIGLTVGLMIASTATFAQSSVSLFGILDEGINFTSNAGGYKAYQVAGGDLATSRWGIKGTEDLGGGLSAVFDLESGFNVENGTYGYDGRLFGYNAFVGLQSDTLGTLTLGRQYSVVTDTVALLTANGNWAGYLFSHPIDNDNTDSTYHAGNSIKYTSNVYGGLSGELLYGFSNQAGGFANNRQLEAGLKYSYETLSLAASYSDLSGAGTTLTGSLPSDDYGIASSNQKIYGIGANYGIGDATVGIVYTHTLVKRATSSIFIGSFGALSPTLKFDNIEANAKYNITPSVLVGGMFSYTRANVDQGGDHSSLRWNQAGLMAQYNFSKRTALYSQFVYQNVSGGTSGTSLDTAYIVGSAGVSSNSHQIMGRFGINHSF